MINSVNYQNFGDRVKFAFKIFDEDEDGHITRGDFIKNLKFYGKENQFSFDEKSVELIVDAIIECIDVNRDGKIQLSELEKFFEGSKRNQLLKIAQF